MNSAFVGYEELSRSRRVLSTEADTLLDLLNSSYPTQPHSLIAKFVTIYVARSRLTCVVEVQKEEIRASAQKVLVQTLL